MTAESDFLRLSRTLTGVLDLDESLVPGLLDRIKKTPESTHLNRLLATYREINESGGDVAAGIKERILNDAELRPLVPMIIVAWYTGDLVTRLKDPPPATEHEYFSGVLWKIARAHPPGLSGGYFGHWTYPPDAG
jgi:hypothetical protein